MKQSKMRLSETDKDTICALATAHGMGAISLLRVSGPKAADIIRKLAAFLPEKLESHKIYYGILRDHESGEPLDEVLVSYFQQGRSFTGETVFEISCHGSESVVNEILRNLVAAGARPANRGEFTYRAFMNGRLDLVQAESVLALIESRSSRASSLAVRQLQGTLSKKLHQIRDQVTGILAHLEANIDFASEDIEIASDKDLVARVDSVILETAEMLSSYRQGRLIREGFQIALCGRPNVGKSSLLNALCGEDRAIVTSIAGTTRDFVEAETTIAGTRVKIIDTAGLRITDDPIEKVGVHRALEKIKDVDLVFVVEDASDPAWDHSFDDFIPWDRSVLLLNKIDLKPGAQPSLDFSKRVISVLPVSAQSMAGLTELRQWIETRVRDELSEDSTVVSNARHFQGLMTLKQSLEVTRELINSGESPDLVALELQIGLQALYEILGQTYDDQVMDRVFAEFCLGK